MSKYYKAENVNDEIVRVLEHTDCKDSYIDDVLRAIESLPTIEVSEDCISREWVLKYITKGVGALADNTETLTDVIKNAPSVVPSRAEGEWLKPTNEYGYECPVCHEYYCTIGNYMNYCPNCGAKMKGIEE